ADEAIEQILRAGGDAETEGEIGQGLHGAQESGHSGSGSPSNQTKMPTENSTMTAASTIFSRRRASRAAYPPTSTSPTIAGTARSHGSATPNSTMASNETRSGRA